MKKLCAVLGLLLVTGTAMLCLAASSRADDEICEENELTFVPNLLGLSHDAAAARLESLGLVLRAVGDQNGRICSQDPAAFTRVAKGSSVNVLFAASSANGPQTNPSANQPHANPSANYPPFPALPPAVPVPGR